VIAEFKREAANTRLPVDTLFAERDRAAMNICTRAQGHGKDIRRGRKTREFTRDAEEGAQSRSRFGCWMTASWPLEH
jgi:hypothetical protein